MPTTNAAPVTTMSAMARRFPLRMTMRCLLCCMRQRSLRAADRYPVTVGIAVAGTPFHRLEGCSLASCRRSKLFPAKRPALKLLPGDVFGGGGVWRPCQGSIDGPHTRVPSGIKIAAMMAETIPAIIRSRIAFTIFPLLMPHRKLQRRHHPSSLSGVSSSASSIRVLDMPSRIAAAASAAATTVGMT